MSEHAAFIQAGTDARLTLPRWHVLYTRSRHEKFVEEELLLKGIDAFVPKVTLKKRWSDRTMLIEEPIFKGYCFALFPLAERVRVLSQKGVVSLIRFNDQYATVDEQVITSLKVLIQNELQVDPYPYLKVGELVRIRKGPLRGFEGFIIEKRQKTATLVVSVDAIAASVKCVVESDMVELA